VGINAIAIRPDNPSIVYVGADSNGIFRSTDCGSTWSLANTGRNAASLSSGRPWSLVIDPVEPDVMYTIEGYGDGGLWKTTNAGVDWDQVLTPNIMALFSLADSVAIDPTDHTHLVVQSHGCTPTTATCLAESTDSGTTWRSLAVPAAWGENSSTVMLNRTTWLFCLLDGGLWRTTDQGVTWKNITPSGAGGASCNYYQPYVFEDTSNVYYLTSWDSASNQTLMRSQPNDSGSWSLMTFTTATIPGGTTLIPTADHIVWSSQFSPNYYIASKNDLSTWSTFPSPPPSGSVGGGGGAFMAYDGSHQILYSGNFKGGLWRIVTN
jgi:hypothetical protein